MALTAYLDQARRLLHDPNAQAYSTADLTVFVNIARRQIAAEGQCVRLLLSGGTITGIAVTSGGAAWVTAPTVTITGAGQQAFATALVSAGAIYAVTVNKGGWGYLTAPTITFSGVGTGGAATATVDNSASTVATREILDFSTLNVLAAQTSGVLGVLGIMSIATLWGATRIVLSPMIWTMFQAYMRYWSTAPQNYPCYWSQYQQGVNGNVYLFPVPSQQLSLDVDAYCLPIDLATDSTPEAIPSPWTDAVPYYTAYLAYDNSQRPEDSMRMFKDYERFMKRARAMSEPPFMPNIYWDLD